MTKHHFNYTESHLQYGGFHLIYFMEITLEKEVTRVLTELEELLLGYKSLGIETKDYPIDALRAICFIFSDVLADRITKLQIEEGIDMVDTKNMASEAGRELRKLIKTYTNIDTHTLYATKTISK